MSRSRARWATITENGNDGVKAEIEGVSFSVVPVGEVQPGDVVPASFGLPGSSRQAIVLGSPARLVEKPYLIAGLTIQAAGLWPIPEGQPRLSYAPELASLPFDSTRTHRALHSLGRVESGTFSYSAARDKMDCLGLLGVQDSSGVRLVSFFQVYASESGQGTKLKIQDCRPDGSLVQAITLEIATRWEGFVGPNGRNFGYLFYRESAGEVFYTIQICGSLVSLRRSHPLTWVVSQLATQGYTPGAMTDGSCAVAGTHAIDCRYTGMDAWSDPVQDQADRCRVNLYRQDGDLRWQPLPVINCRDFVPAGTLIRIYPVGLTSHVGIPDDSAHEHFAKWIGDGSTTHWPLPVGTGLDATVTMVRIHAPGGSSSDPSYTTSGSTVITDPIPAGHLLQISYTLDEAQIVQELPWLTSLQSSRWPYLSLASKREWWWHMVCQLSGADDTPRYLQILATDAETGDTGLVWRDGPEDWDGAEVIPGIVSSQLSTLQSQSAASIAPGAEETVLYSGQQAVSTTCTPAGIPAEYAPLDTWLRGFVLEPLDSGRYIPRSEPILTQPQPDRWQFDENWNSQIGAVEQDSAQALSWSRQLASGTIDAAGNHYLIYNRAHPYATGIGTTTLFDRHLLEESDWIFTFFQYPPEGEEYGNNGWGYSGIDTPSVNPGWSVLCTNDPYASTKRWYASRVSPFRAFTRLWRTYLVSHTPARTRRYKADISLRYNLPNGWQQVPCHAAVWAHVVVGDRLVVLREDFWHRSGSTLIGFETEPALELRVAESGALIGRINLHPSSDSGHRYIPHPHHNPTIRINRVNGGPNQAIVCCRWSDGLDALNPAADGHSLHVIDLDTLTKAELWGTGLKPTGFPSSQELCNSVLHGGTLYWIDGAVSLAAI
jgi:hypothetical protein